jgi:Ca2+/H+ antiporter, TMEM165/GDT1 family
MSTWPGSGPFPRLAKRSERVDPVVALICFPVVFLGELPDKTMFANLVMATKGRPLQVWLGAAGAFAVHVTIAVTVGVALFHLLPHQVVEAVVAGMFLVGAAYAWWDASRGTHRNTASQMSRQGALLTAFAVIFVAEWGDLTQVLTADLAAKYHSPVSVAVGSITALWCVAGLAVVGGQSTLRSMQVTTVRRLTAVVLVVLAGYSAWAAAH